MEISNMTSIFGKHRTGERIPVIESVRRLKALGYNRIDLNLCGMADPGGIFTDENWYREICEIREEADRIGIKFIQAHTPFYDGRIVDPARPEYNEFFVSMMMRSAEILKIASVPTTIVHPMAALGAAKENTELNIAENHRFYDAYLDKLGEIGVCAAFENMVSPARFGCFTSELLALRDSFSDRDNIEFCWDIGHGNLVYPDQTWAIGQLSGHIRAVHLHDNLGKTDDHLMPFLGTVDWENVMPALRRAGFCGDLVLEISPRRGMPDDLMETSVEFSMKLSRKLLELYNSENC